MRFALYLIAAVSGEAQTESWVLDGNLTYLECDTRAKELAPTFALMGAGAYLECGKDHAPDTWD